MAAIIFCCFFKPLTSMSKTFLFLFSFELPFNHDFTFAFMSAIVSVNYLIKAFVLFFVGPQVPWRAFKLVAELFGSKVSQDDVEIYRNMYT